MPDSWYILPNGTLYNPGDGHKGTSLVNDMNNIKRMLEQQSDFTDCCKPFFEQKERIEREGFNFYDFKSLLNYRYYPTFLDKTHEFPTSHDKIIQHHILGVIEAKIFVYKFFEDLFKSTNSPLEEFNKIFLENKDFGSFFVRCCGFHKVESQLDKTITTSDINYKESLKEYINHGWDIAFIPPIVINRELGSIEELSESDVKSKQYIKNLWNEYHKR